jgi:cyanophycin synthetase
MERKTIKFLKIFPLRGPSLWTYRPALEAWVDIGDLEDCPSHMIPGFVERLCAWLPTLSGHRCSYGEPGGFIKRLHEGTWPAHILEHVTLELQNLAGMPGGFGKARETGVRGIYKVVVSARQEDVTRACLEAARNLVMAAIEDSPFDVNETVARLGALAEQHMLGPSTACIVAAAEEKDRRIPTMRLSPDNLVQLGYGARQKRIWAAETELTGAIAEGITRDPSLSHRLLKTCGLPVPPRALTESVDEAWEEAEDMGLPVYVKPSQHGTGDPRAEVSNRVEMEAAWQNFSGKRAEVIVEKIIPGKPHRLLVVGAKLVAAARLDGGAGSSNVPNSAADVTELVHPSTTEAACLAAKIVGLDIAGVDVMLEEVERPLSADHGAIIAVHAAPGLVTHLHPASGEPRPVGRSIIDGLFPDGDDGRIPVVGITGSEGTTAVARLIAEFLRLSGKQTGLACGDGLFFNRRQVETTDCGNWHSGRRILMNRSVEAAVMENSADVILGEGLPYDRCQVGVVTRIVPEHHYGRYYIDSPERVIQVIRTQVDVVLPDGVAVLNAEDPMVAEMAPLCDGEVVFYAEDPSHPVLTTHLTHGGRAVTIRDGNLILASASEENLIAPLSSIPFISNNPGSVRTGVVLAAVAAAWALGVALHVLCTGVETFSNEPHDANEPDPSEPEAFSSMIHRA